MLRQKVFLAVWALTLVTYPVPICCPGDQSTGSLARPTFLAGTQPVTGLQCQEIRD